MTDIKSYLRTRIRQKLNPYYSCKKGLQKKIYLSERCTEEEFLSMFPTAKVFSVLPATETQFQRHRKTHEATFSKITDLDEVLGERWDLVFNGVGVGCALPTISFRLVSTTITSWSMVDDKKIESTDEITTINITIFRTSLSRLESYDSDSDKYTESDWHAKVKRLQKSNPKLVKKRLAMFKKLKIK